MPTCISRIFLTKLDKTMKNINNQPQKVNIDLRLEQLLDFVCDNKKDINRIFVTSKNDVYFEVDIEIVIHSLLYNADKKKLMNLWILNTDAVENKYSLFIG